MEFRKYQIDAVWAAHLYLLNPKDYSKSFIVAPTGSGKSWIIAGIAHKFKEPILILQPNKELLLQNYEKYTKSGNKAAIYSASLKSKEVDHVTFATIGSIKSKVHLFDQVKLVIVD